MKKLLLLGFAVCAASTILLRAQTDEETLLVGVIQSSAKSTEKEDACRQLKRIGTTNSVIALATLLTDEHLYQAACDALEAMPFKAAEAALLAALGKTEGKTKAGIIHAIGEHRLKRGEPRNPSTVPVLVPLLKDSDPLIASAAARALAQMGEVNGRAAANALLAEVKTATEPTRSAEVDALLHWEQVDWELVMKISQQLSDPRENEHVRAAAYKGFLTATYAGGYQGPNEISNALVLKMVMAGIEGDDNARQLAALRFARDIYFDGLSLNVMTYVQAFTNLLPKVSPAKQAALVCLFEQRKLFAAAPAVLELLGSKDSYVRATAVAALGTLGDASVVPPLARIAASGEETEQKAARQALIALRLGKVGETLVAQLATASPEVQAELARALAARFEKSAVRPLLELARSDSEATRKAAVRALSLLADGSHLPALVKLLGEAANEAARTDVRGVFESLVDRADAKKIFDVAPIVAALNTAKPEVQAALLQVGSIFADERLRAAFRAALQNSDATIRAAAARALCDSRDAGLILDLFELAHTNSDLTLRTLALDGYVRLVSDERSGFAPAKRFELLKPAYELATRAEERRRVLSALGNVPLRGALDLAEGALADADVKAEAEIACAQIAKALLNTDPDAAETMLLRLSESAATESSRTNALFILKQFDSGWRCAGPYREKDKAGNELFDVVFPPEQGDSADVKWKRAPGSDRHGEVVLNDLTGGDNCVMYLKTRVFVPSARTVNLEIGSDDGIKLWVNGQVVHANNTGRGVAPGQDKAKASLREGWNDFLAKITQIVGGCGMILEIKSEDGKKISKLKFDPRASTN